MFSEMGQLQDVMCEGIIWKNQYNIIKFKNKIKFKKKRIWRKEVGIWGRSQVGPCINRERGEGYMGQWNKKLIQFSSVQLLSRVRLFATP